MHHKQFELYRRLLFLTVLEAARNVACTEERPDGVSERAWNRWEAGEAPIPPQVAANLQALVDKRQAELAQIARRLDGGEVPQVACNLPAPSDVAQKKLRMSVAAQAAAMGAQIVEVVS